MALFQQAARLLVSEQCYDEYFVKFNFFDVPCFLAVFSKALGYAITLASIVVKVPQILKIYNTKSGAGISITSLTLELSAMAIAFSYNFVKQFPFSAYGDVAFLTLQTAAIAFLVLKYSSDFTKAAAYISAYSGLCYILCFVTPMKVLWTLQGINIPIIIAAKLSQAFTNYKNGHTGQLSAVTIFMLVGGSIARIFTSYQETGDAMLIVTYTAATLSNLVIGFQMVYYWNIDVNKIEKKKQ